MSKAYKTILLGNKCFSIECDGKENPNFPKMKRNKKCANLHLFGEGDCCDFVFRAKTESQPTSLYRLPTV